MSTVSEWRQESWEAIPSINAIIPNDRPVTWAILTVGTWGGASTPIVLATGLPREVADHIVSLQNSSLRGIP